MGQPVFSLNDIEIFLTVYLNKSMSSSAEQLFLSRQSVARSIDALEQQCRHALFVRSASGMLPTDFCHDFYKKASVLFANARSLMDFSINYDSALAPISLALIGQYKMGLKLEALIEAFCQEHPSCTVNISYYGWPEVLDAVERNEVDCAYTALLPGRTEESFQCFELARYRFMILAGRDADEGEAVQAKDLEKKHIVLYSPFRIHTQVLEEYAKAHGLSFMPPIVSADMFLVEDYIGQDSYAVLVDESVAKRLTRPEAKYAKLVLEPPLIRRSGLIFRKEFTMRDEHKKLMKFLRHELTEPY